MKRSIESSDGSRPGEETSQSSERTDKDREEQTRRVEAELEASGLTRERVPSVAQLRDWYTGDDQIDTQVGILIGKDNEFLHGNVNLTMLLKEINEYPDKEIVIAASEQLKKIVERSVQRLCNPGNEINIYGQRNLETRHEFLNVCKVLEQFGIKDEFSDDLETIRKFYQKYNEGEIEDEPNEFLAEKEK